MKDLNFFEPYIEKREFKVDRKLVYASLGILIVIIFFVYSVFNYILIRQEEKTIASLKEIGDNEQTLQKIEEIKEKQAEVEEFRESVDKIVMLDESLQKTDKIASNLLEDITRKMPNEVFITSISISASDIQIVGIAEDNWSIAEFGRGLEDIDLGDVFISNISNQDNHYNFNINIMTEDVIGDGEIVEEAED